MKVVLKNQFMSQDVKFMLAHCEKNVIDLDSSCDSDNSNDLLHGEKLRLS